VDDLILFLNSRLDEAEDRANALRQTRFGRASFPAPTREAEATRDFMPYEITGTELLADVEAKRLIVALHSVNVSAPKRRESVCERDMEDMPCDTLRLLAMPYASHEHYREEWRI
jgi:hypothetical protein